MLASVASVATCFRCEWSSVAGRRRRCPRCGVSLYVMPPPPRQTPPPEAGEMEPLLAGRRRWQPVVIVLAFVVLPTVASFVTGDGGEVRSGDGGMAEELRPVLASSHAVKVPPALLEAAGPAGDRVTFATRQEVGLYRLWRLELGKGRVVPGPVVARPIEILLQPGAGDRRLAFRVHGGALFSLRGFHAARPQWLTGDVSSFGLGADGVPVGVSIRELVAPWGSGSELRVSVAPVTPPLRRGSPTIDVRGLDARGARVVGSRAYVWGAREDHGFVLEVDPSGRRPGELDLHTDEVIDVAPDRSLLVTAPDGHPLIRRPDGSRIRFGLEAESVTAWSPNARWAVVRGAIEPTDRWLWLVSARTGAARPLGRYPGAAGFSSDSRIVLWTEEGALGALDLATNLRFEIGLPTGFPRIVGPIVAG